MATTRYLWISRLVWGGLIVTLLWWVGLMVVMTNQAAALPLIEAGVNRILALTRGFPLLFPVSPGHIVRVSKWVIPSVVGVTGLAVFALLTRPTAGMTRRQGLSLFTGVLLLGVIARLTLAYITPGNFDMQSYGIVARIVEQGGNVYAETARYNYAPVWFVLLGAMRRLEVATGVFFPAIVRSFLTLVDLGICGLLVVLARRDPLPVVAFFFLNPVSFLITGFHGQFENLTILLLLAGITAYGAIQSERLSVGVLWAAATAAVLVKHIVFYMPLVLLNKTVERLWVRAALYAASGAVVLVSFVPYLTSEAAIQGVRNNVILYAGVPRAYGVMTLVNTPWWTYAFAIGLFVFPFFIKTDDLIDASLLMLLFFVTFIPSVSIQYLVLPVALGALRPSRGFFAYSVVVGLFMVGNVDNIYIPFFEVIGWNAVWVAALYWFILEASPPHMVRSD